MLTCMTRFQCRPTYSRLYCRDGNPESKHEEWWNSIDKSNAVVWFVVDLGAKLSHKKNIINYIGIWYGRHGMIRHSQYAIARPRHLKEHNCPKAWEPWEPWLPWHPPGRPIHRLPVERGRWNHRCGGNHFWFFRGDGWRKTCFCSNKTFVTLKELAR